VVNKKIKMKGFTLVELLAVIVILAIILVIAVPKIMDVINDSKKATLESTAKMIASQAEKQKVQNTVLGNTDEITCESITNINDVDYEDCDIDFDNNTAKVTIKGSGKFDGLWVCDGTKTTAVATEEECALVCKANELMIDSVTVITPYEVKNYDSCVSYMNNLFGEVIGQEAVTTLCSGNGLETDSFSGDIEIIMDIFYLTESDLIENNVIEVTIEKGCLETSLEECFTFDSEDGTITAYDISCGTGVVIPNKISNVKVKHIADDAFYKLGIESVYISNSVEYIGSDAFNRNSLNKVYLGNLNAELGNCAFGIKNSNLYHNLPSSYVCAH